MVTESIGVDTLSCKENIDMLWSLNHMNFYYNKPSGSLIKRHDSSSSGISVVAIEMMGSVSEILGMLEEAKFGERHVIVYPDLDGFNKICGRYTKKHLERDNEIVVLLPFYQTVDSVIATLHRKYDIDVRKYGEQGSLLIMDSYKTYTGFREDRELLFRRILSHAAMSGKIGISIFMDMGVFSFIQEIEKIAVNFRDFLSSQQEPNIKAFFSYHKKDYDKLSDEKKSIRFSNNYTSFIVG